VSFDGRFFKLKNAFLGLKPVSKPHPPVYVGGYGPRMRRLAIELGDGWIPWVESPETYRKNFVEMEGYAADLGRSLSIDMGVEVDTWITKEVDEARQVVRSRLKGVLPVRPRLLRNLGYPELARESVGLWRLSFVDSQHLDKLQSVAEKIPPEVVDEITIVGTPDYAIERIEEYVDAGVKLLIVACSSESFEETLNAYRKVIIPHFRQ